MTDYTFDRPSHWLQWAQKTFGDVALHPAERAMRFAEEAVELAHALGADPATLRVIIERVYSRPAGAINREVGQCLATLELLAHVLGVDADAEANAELARVKSIPQAEWDKRHSAKVAQGFALPKRSDGHA